MSEEELTRDKRVLQRLNYLLVVIATVSLASFCAGYSDWHTKKQLNDQYAQQVAINNAAIVALASQLDAIDDDNNQLAKENRELIQINGNIQARSEWLDGRLKEYLDEANR